MSAPMSTDRQITGKEFDCFVSDADGQAVRPKVTTVTDRRTRKIIDMDISTARAQRIKRMAKLFALVKDIAALFAVTLFVLPILPDR